VLSSCYIIQEREGAITNHDIGTSSPMDQMTADVNHTQYTIKSQLFVRDIAVDRSSISYDHTDIVMPVAKTCGKNADFGSAMSAAGVELHTLGDAWVGDNSTRKSDRIKNPDWRFKFTKVRIC
jgi:hypothetical protein